MEDITEFYGIACNIVKAWPAVYPVVGGPEATCLRPQSFAGLHSDADLEADNFAKAVEHSREPYLFVRGYADNAIRGGLKVEYPLIAVAEDAFSIRNFLARKGNKATIQTLNLIFVDQLPYAKNNNADVYTMARTDQEVGRDLRKMALTFLDSLTNWAKIEFKSGPYVDGWHDALWLAANDPTADWDESQMIPMVSLLPSGAEINGDILYKGTDNTVRLYLNLAIQVNACPMPLEFNYVYAGGSLVAPLERWRYDTQ